MIAVFCLPVVQFLVSRTLEVILLAQKYYLYLWTFFYRFSLRKSEQTVFLWQAASKNMSKDYVKGDLC